MTNKNKQNVFTGISHHDTAETNLTRYHNVVGLIPGLGLWVNDPALL